MTDTTNYCPTCGAECELPEKPLTPEEVVRLKAWLAKPNTMLDDVRWLPVDGFRYEAETPLPSL